MNNRPNQSLDTLLAQGGHFIDPATGAIVGQPAAAPTADVNRPVPDATAAFPHSSKQTAWTRQ